jgi:hypothetical protein
VFLEIGLHAVIVEECVIDIKQEQRAFGSSQSLVLLLVIPAERAGLRAASESLNPVIDDFCEFRPAVNYWIRMR